MLLYGIVPVKLSNIIYTYTLFICELYMKRHWKLKMLRANNYVFGK